MADFTVSLSTATESGYYLCQGLWIRDNGTTRIYESRQYVMTGQVARIIAPLEVPATHGEPAAVLPGRLRGNVPVLWPSA